MAVNIRGRSFLKLLDYTPAEIRYLLDLSKNFKDMKRAGVPHRWLEGKDIVLLFEKTSTRTRCSFEVAGMDLGMGVTYLEPGSSQMGKKESIADTARVLGRMYDGIEYRGYGQSIVEELAKYAGVPVWNGLTNECITADSDSTFQLPYPSRIDAFIVGIGTDGETTVTFNLQDYRIRRNSMFVFSPQSILQTAPGEHFRAHVLIVSREMMQRINIDTKHIMPVLLQFGAHPCIELTEEESREVRNFFSLVGQELRTPETELSRDIVGDLLSASIYKIGSVLHRYVREHPETERPPQTRAEEYFKEFIRQLGEHFRQERSVGYYAQRLCITPKYLTTLVKRISGRSVSEWIDTFVITEAKTLLKYSNLSIQEIAYQLNFPNQSFFGSYFKRNTGMSPSQYKAQK